MNKLDKDYCNLLQDILDNGVEKKDRTGTGTISVFGRQIRHKMSEGFPLLTSKKMYMKGIVTELLWFLRGDTNIKYLVDNDCHIWDGDAYKGYEKQCEIHNVEPMEKEKFSSAVKLGNNKEPHFIPDLTGYQLGDLGPIYGKQWRGWEKWYIDENQRYLTFTKKIDQIANLISELKTNPDSRRLMVSAWNVGEIDSMVLPPCHYGFQVYTRELSMEERIKTFEPFVTLNTHEECDNVGLPKRAISLMWNQRSVDTFLGLPFNIASYGLLLEIIAKEVNMVPDELIGNLGDTHLYSNHVEQAKEQIGRVLTYDERTEMLKEAMGIENYKNAIKELMPFGGGMSEYYEAYKIPHRTREPFPLPKLIINDEFWNHDYQTIDGWIKSMEIGDFTLENYQSHPSIKAPLSN